MLSFQWDCRVERVHPKNLDGQVPHCLNMLNKLHTFFFGKIPHETFEFRKTHTITPNPVVPLSWLSHTKKSYSVFQEFIPVHFVSAKKYHRRVSSKYQKLKKSKDHKKRWKNNGRQESQKKHQHFFYFFFHSSHLRHGQTRKDRIDVRYMTGGLVDHHAILCFPERPGELVLGAKIRPRYLFHIKSTLCRYFCSVLYGISFLFLFFSLSIYVYLQ